MAGEFDEGALLAEARERAGLSDFGDESFIAPLRELLRALREAPLNAGGRAGQHERLVASLAMRLTFHHACQQHPEILEEQIAAPLVVVGQARTGTTRLHRLLASDPGLFAARWWEVRSPAPPPEVLAAPAAPDPRIAEAHQQVRWILETQPVLASIHPWDAEAPDEEIMLAEHSFLSHVPESGAHLPAYRRWLDSQDFAPSYDYTKRLLQFLQWQKRRRGESAERWVLKTPQHLGYLELLFETFPGALVIQTHRDPLETIPSVASMYAALWGLSQDEVDFHEVGRQCLERYAWAMQRGLAARDRMPPERFCDVWFRDVGRDALGQVRRIYAAAGRTLGAEAEAAMSAWLRNNPRDARPMHEYSLEKFGLSEAAIADAFADYRARFILPRAQED